MPSPIMSGSPASIQSTGHGSSRRRFITLPPRSHSARRIANARFTVPTGNFGDIFAGHVARRMGLPVDRLVIATNVNDILVRTLATGAYEPREVVATSFALDGHPGVVEFRAAAVRGLWSQRRASGGADEVISRSRSASRSRVRLVRKSVQVSPPAVPVRTKSPPPCARPCARPDISSIRIPPSASRSPRKNRAIRRCRWSCSPPRMRRNFRMRSKRPVVCVRNCRTGCPVLNERREHVDHTAVRPESKSKHSYLRPRGPRVKEPPHERRSHPSAVRTDRRDGRHAASGDRLARRLGRRRQPRRARRRARHFAPSRTHGLQGHQAAAPRARSPRRSRRSAATSMPRPRSRRRPITRAC